MQFNNDNGEGYITVVPYYAYSSAAGKRLRVSKLGFWYNNICDHPVNDETVKMFLKHAEMFGASVYPNHPEFGCAAMGGTLLYTNGETSVCQIIYKSELIYCWSSFKPGNIYTL
jgi:hypothetical protein